MAKKVVLSGYYGYDNFGDEAILSVLISHLQQIGADITVLSHNPQKQQVLIKLIPSKTLIFSE